MVLVNPRVPRQPAPVLLLVGLFLTAVCASLLSTAEGTFFFNTVCRIAGTLRGLPKIRILHLGRQGNQFTFLLAEISVTSVPQF